MMHDAEPPNGPDFEATDREWKLRRTVEDAHSAFHMKPGNKTADALTDAVVSWRDAAVPALKTQDGEAREAITRVELAGVIHAVVPDDDNLAYLCEDDDCLWYDIADAILARYTLVPVPPGRRRDQMSDERETAWERYVSRSTQKLFYDYERAMFDAAWDAGRASRDAEVAAAVARADAAEAVIAAAERGLDKWATAAPIAQMVVAEVRSAMGSVFAQSVLAERDRKNREAAWDEGYTSSRGFNPYTEKEAGSNGN